MKQPLIKVLNDGKTYRITQLHWNSLGTLVLIGFDFLDDSETTFMEPSRDEVDVFVGIFNDQFKGVLL